MRLRQFMVYLILLSGALLLSNHLRGRKRLRDRAEVMRARVAQLEKSCTRRAKSIADEEQTPGQRWVWLREKNLAYCPLPRVASETLSYHLLSSLDLSMTVEYLDSMPHVLEHLKGHAMSERVSADKLSGSRNVIFVRHPFHQLVSVFNG